MSDEETAVTEETMQTSTQNTESEKGPELSVQDLASIKSIIDVASQRGAFKPGEMVTVGQTYNKLEAFLAAVTAEQEKGA